MRRMPDVQGALGLALAVVVSASTAGCAREPAAAEGRVAYAVFGEYARDSNKLMKGGLNRRVFNVTEAGAGDDIALLPDGCIRLRPGTYRLEGFSLATMQVSLAPPVPQHGSNYPGYAVVYPREYENAGLDLLPHAAAVGSPAASLDTTPSFFDNVYGTEEPVDLCVGHQAGADLHDEVYLSVYEVDGVKSDYHVHARITITRVGPAARRSAVG